MNDLIRKEDALMQARPEYLNPQQKKLASYNQGWNDAIDEYFDRIKEIPAADKPKDEWIPCSERLPENDELMLVYYIDPRENAVDTWIGWHEMENVWYIDGKAHGKEFGNEVLAWMPLPKPYIEDGE
jgi:hypothetical protein